MKAGDVRKEKLHNDLAQHKQFRYRSCLKLLIFGVLVVMLLSSACGLTFERKEGGDRMRLQEYINQLSIDTDIKTSRKAFTKLYAKGIEAFDVLIDNLDNDIQSHWEFGGDVEGKITIAYVCRSMITGQLEPQVSKHRPYYPYDNNMKAWWQKNKSRTLKELQLDVLLWMINEIQTKDSWQERRTFYLEQLNQHCKKKGLSGQCGLKVGMLKMRVSLLNKETGKINVSLSNTGEKRLVLMLNQKESFSGNIIDKKDQSIAYTLRYVVPDNLHDSVTIMPSEVYNMDLMPREIDGYGKDILWKDIPSGSFNLQVYYENKDCSQNYWTGFVYAETKVK